MRLIGLAGKKRSGKNTVAEMIQDVLYEHYEFDYKYEAFVNEISFAEKMKDWVFDALPIGSLDKEYQLGPVTRDDMDGLGKLDRDHDQLKDVLGLEMDEEWDLFRKIWLQNFTDILAKEGYEEHSFVNYEDLWTVETIRDALLIFGTEVARQCFDEDIWLKEAMLLVDEDDLNVITDTRFDNEAQVIRDHGGIVVVINRDHEFHGSKDDHVSESGISPELVDHVIFNNSDLEDLKIQVRQFLTIKGIIT